MQRALIFSLSCLVFALATALVGLGTMTHGLADAELDALCGFNQDRYTKQNKECAAANIGPQGTPITVPASQCYRPNLAGNPCVSCQDPMSGVEISTDVFIADSVNGTETGYAATETTVPCGIRKVGYCIGGICSFTPGQPLVNCTNSLKTRDPQSSPPGGL